MTENPAKPISPEPLERSLTGADDRLLLNHWLPPQTGIVPQIRIGQRWVSVMWGLPIGTTALIVLIAAAQSLRELPGVQALIKQYPGIAQAASANAAAICGAVTRPSMRIVKHLVRRPNIKSF